MNERLRALPLDPKRKLPVPFAQVVRPDGTADFAAVDGDKVLRCGRDRLCGLCGQQLDYWIAFIGGPASVTNRVFIDPPMHRECAKDAFTLCPHLARPLVSRRPASEDTGVPVGWSENKPQTFGMYITRDYSIKLVRLDIPGGVGPQFTAAPAKTVRWWQYVDGLAVETNDQGVTKAATASARADSESAASNGTDV